MTSRIQLSSDQKEIVDFAARGHNILITGQAGVGKSEVVKEIIHDAKARGCNVGVICSSGIACHVYDRGIASTVHSYYGLLTADLLWRQVVDRSQGNSIIRDRVKALDVIIWDEASMSSQRIFELVNILHHELAVDAVSRLMRQSEADKNFLAALSELRMGKCCKNTEDYLSTLQRGLPLSLEEGATHIFFRKVPVMLFNRRKLDKLPGHLINFDAFYENDTSKNMNWPGSHRLQLKQGCKVMLVWNKSDALKNGSIGVFTGVKDDVLQVSFEGVGVVKIGRETWTKRNRSGQRVGSISQFPLVLAYAVTCHKSQGLTLSSAVIHCSREYVPGLIYVAVSRVKSAECIQILDFSARQLLRPQRKVIEICSSNHTFVPVVDLSCCCRRSFDNENLLSVQDRFSADCEENEPFSFPTELLDGPVRACFEDDGVPVPFELMQVYDQLSKHDSNLSSPPPECFETCRGLLSSWIKDDAAISSFLEEKNNAIRFMLEEDSSEKVQSFIKVIWFHSFLIVESHIIENPEEIVVDIGRQGFTQATGKLYAFFNSIDFSSYVCGVFCSTECTSPMRAVAVQLATSIYMQFLEHLASVVRQNEQNDEIDFSVEEMSGVGRSKVRHVGGWAVRKVLTRARKYIQKNLYSASTSTFSNVEKQHQLCQLLEENVIVPYAKLEELTVFPETLEVTEGRQYRERGLLHISDEAYLFFMHLEKRRVELLNLRILKNERGDMVELAMSKLSHDEHLKSSWFTCFENDDADKNKGLIEKLLSSILLYYVNMGASQFLRDFRRSSLLKKSVQLRKRIMQRREKVKEKTDSVPFKEILKDRSERKCVSHGRLVAFMHQHKDIGALSRVYLKPQLIALCEAYGIQVSSRSSKPIIERILVDAVSKHVFMPLSVPVDDREYRVLQASNPIGGHIRIRLVRGDP